MILGFCEYFCAFLRNIDGYQFSIKLGGAIKFKATIYLGVCRQASPW